MRPKSEWDIHDIIKHYPYFLGDNFADMVLIHERIYPDRTRADFKFSNDQKIVIVEVKKGIINIPMLNQATGYMDKERLQNSEKVIEGLLVGLPPSNAKLEKKIDNSKYRISQKFINVDVPSNGQQIKICANCRRANWQRRKFCEYCGSPEFIEDPFMFAR